MQINTNIEKSYRKQKNGTYQEYIYQFLYFKDLKENVQIKLDQTFLGNVYTARKLLNSESILITESGKEKRIYKLS